MGKVNINLSGISSSSVYTDGEMMSLVNLRKKTGALEPVPPRKIIKTLSEAYDLVFVHQLPSGDEKYIGVKGNTIYHDGAGSLGTIADVISIQQIGNVLIFITESDKHYAIYRDTAYVFLGSIPELPKININTFEVDSDRYLAFNATKTNYTTNVKGALNLAYENSFNALGRALCDAHFLIYALKLYDGTYIKHSSPLLILPPYNIFSGMFLSYDITLNSEPLSNSSVTIKTYGIKFYKDGAAFDGTFPELQQWKGIVESVDFFLSPALGVSNVEMFDKDEHDFENHTHNVSTNAIKTFRDSAKENINDISNFYLIRSLPVDQTGYISPVNPQQFPSGTTLPLDKKDDDVIQNLTSQSELTEMFSASRETWGALQSYIYNSRLHLANIKTKLFNGHKPNTIAIYNGLVGLDDKPYNGHSIPWLADYAETIATKVDIKLPDGLVSVWSYSDMEESNIWLGSPYFSYPDIRAVKITFYVYVNGDSTWKLMYEASLKKHSFLNVAYYLNPTLSPVENISSLTPDSLHPEHERDVITIEQNKLKVSEVSNPFVFTDKNTYIIGSERIRNMASNSMRISEGQFGQYPLYVFTTENIYALNIGTEALYSNVSPVSNETPTSDIICQTPFGIIFIGKRGLFVINGQQVEHITPQLETFPLQYAFSLPSVGTVPRVAKIKTWNDFFLDYLSGVSEIVYNSKESELILLNKTKGYNFVYNIDNKSWYQSTESVDLFVKNVFPELYGVLSTSVKDFSTEKTTTTGTAPNQVTTVDKAEVSFVTRPLNFGLYELKKLERVILRARLDAADDVLILTNNAIDDINFSLDKGMKLNNANYKDIYLGMMTKKYRQIVLMFAAKLKYSSRIYSISAEVEKANQKMI